MKQLDLKDAFPPMDEGFERAANRAFGQIREEQNMKHRGKFSVVLVMLLVLALAGTALAAGIGRLRQELQGIGASGAVEAVKDVDQAVSADGCTVTVKETLVEGAGVWITLEFETPDDQPMLAALWEDNEDVRDNSPLMLDEMMYLVGGEYADSYTMYVETIDGTALEDMLLKIEIALAKPTVDIVKMTDGREWDQMVSGVTQLSPEGPLMALDIENYSMNGFVIVTPWMRQDASGTPAERTNDLLGNMVTAGVAEKVVRLTAPVEIKSGDVGEYMRTGVKQSEFVFDGYRVEVELVLVGEVKTNLRFRVIANREMEEMNMDNDDPLWRAYEIFDDETGAQFHASSSGGTERDENGNVYYWVELFADGVGAHSDTLRVVPFEYVPDPEGEFNTINGKASIQYCEDEAFVIELIP